MEAGFLVGVAVGLSDGDLEGESVGLPVTGLSVGGAVSSGATGCFVGDEDGLFVGLRVMGASVGDLLGDPVGLPVTVFFIGEAVGPSVGGLVSVVTPVTH